MKNYLDKDIVEEVTRLQFFNIADSNNSIENQDEYKKVQGEMDRLTSEINKKVPKELETNINELINMTFDLAMISNIYYFRRGVESGFYELDFLRKLIVNEGNGNRRYIKV